MPLRIDTIMHICHTIRPPHSNMEVSKRASKAKKQSLSEKETSEKEKQEKSRQESLTLLGIEKLAALGLRPVFRRQEMNGNCNLYCNVRILQAADPIKYKETTAASLRAEMCDELLVNRHKYDAFVADIGSSARDKDYPTYVRRLRLDKAYVDHPAMQALAALYPKELKRILLLSIDSGTITPPPPPSSPATVTLIPPIQR